MDRLLRFLTQPDTMHVRDFPETATDQRMPQSRLGLRVTVGGLQSVLL